MHGGNGERVDTADEVFVNECIGVLRVVACNDLYVIGFEPFFLPQSARR